MGKSASSDTAGAGALLSVATEDDRLGFSKTGPIFLCIVGRNVFSVCLFILDI